MTTPGTLYLVPAPLDFGCDTTAALTDVLPTLTLHTAARLTHWICENAKSCRAYLKRIDTTTPLATPLQQLHIQELPRHIHKKGDHTPHTAFDARALLAPALAGHDIGLASEAGMPAVADPGSSVVQAAHTLGVPVVPLTGPISLLLALAASGLNGQNFAFTGYLPQDPPARVRRIRELEELSQRQGQTQLFIETPYRNAALWQALLHTLHPATRLLQASGLTLSSARILCHTVRDWRHAPPAQPDNRTPTVFGLGQ